MADEVEFLPADKHKIFLQDGSITLGVISQTCPKYQNQFKLVCNIFAILKENMSDEIDFLPTDKYWRFFSN